mgnify:FL=1
MKKVFLITVMSVLLSCDNNVPDNASDYDRPFLEQIDGFAFVNSSKDSNKYLFFYNSEIFLKEVFDFNGDTLCDTTEEGSNTDDGDNFTATITDKESPSLSVIITFTDEEGKFINRYYTYELRWKSPLHPEVIVSEVDEKEECSGCEKIYIKTPITHSSLCNSSNDTTDTTSSGYTVLSTSSNF